MVRNKLRNITKQQKKQEGAPRKQVYNTNKVTKRVGDCIRSFWVLETYVSINKIKIVGAYLLTNRTLLLLQSNNKLEDKSSQMISVQIFYSFPWVFKIFCTTMQVLFQLGSQYTSCSYFCTAYWSLFLFVTVTKILLYKV